MVGMLARDGESVRRALNTDGEEVKLSVSRKTAELVALVIDARARGQQIVFTRADSEVTPNEATALLGMSRPQLRKLIDQGLIESRMVGSHHRIRVESIHEYLDAERERRSEALRSLSHVQNELGLTD